ncbi:hypothetical protein LLEC1_04985 [Akanthomyces lecanii]|uniref:Uncharacterized protein n=1 Tax=Cordyceps confragosa TaxID=2714763 RepID=A0A179I244_CORDF|nr:hypothetical protein LLEC1_04985 [Akanthomyces lecanii]
MAVLPSDKNTLAALPEELTQYAVDNQLLAVLVVLPLFAYPLLPSARRSGIRCEMFLIWSSLLSAVILKTATWSKAAPGLVLGEFWQGAMLTISATAGIEGLRVPRSRRAEPEDFHYAAKFMQGFALLRAVDWLLDAVGSAAAEAGWPLYIFRLLTSVVGFMIVGGVSALFLEIHAKDMILRFMTRQVAWWLWLPENGAEEDFGPPWSIAAAVAVGLAPVAVSVIIANAW